MKTIQIRDVDDDTYTELARRAGAAGITVPEFIRRELARVVSRPALGEWLERTGRRRSAIDRAAVLDALDELRGEWPNAGR